MSRKHDRADARAKRAAALLSELRELHNQTRAAGGGRKATANRLLVQHLRRVNASSAEVWALVKPLLAGLTDPEERDELAALTAQIVNPQLAGMTPGSVHDRLARGGPGIRPWTAGRSPSHKG